MDDVQQETKGWVGLAPMWFKVTLGMVIAFVALCLTLNIRVGHFADDSVDFYLSAVKARTELSTKQIASANQRSVTIEARTDAERVDVIAQWKDLVEHYKAQGQEQLATLDAMKNILEQRVNNHETRITGIEGRLTAVEQKVNRLPKPKP